MEITKQNWNEAADVLDVAHDVLLATGVQCGGTTESFDGNAEANCVWQAIAIAFGSYTSAGLPDWGKTYAWCVGAFRTTRGVTGVQLAIGDAMNGFGPSANDNATEDEVFESLRQGVKFAREQASGAEC